MNGRLERAAMLAGVFILLLSAQFCACLAGGAASIIGAMLLSVAATWLWHRFDLPAGGVWVQPLICSVAVLLSVALTEVTLRPDFFAWFSPLAAALGSGVTLAILRRSEQHCSLCNRPLALHDVVFSCPRCKQQVCEEVCWQHDYRRCRLCLEHRVSVLPLDEGWWLRNAGPRTMHDRCTVCRAAPNQADLRNCPKCRRPQYRDCWDFHNGECQRCGTALPHLPASLTITVTHGAGDVVTRPI